MVVRIRLANSMSIAIESEPIRECVAGIRADVEMEDRAHGFVVSGNVWNLLWLGMRLRLEDLKRSSRSRRFR